jgi:protein TonB
METKKYEHRRIERKIPLFYMIGLNVAIALTLVAFEWRTEPSAIVDFDNQINTRDWDEPPVIPDLPKPIEIPKPQVAITINATEIEPPEIPDITLDNDMPESVPDVPFIPNLIPDEKPDVIHDIVEVDPEFPGGWAAFYKKLGKTIKYPKQASSIGIEGKVYVEFIIEKDGSISNMKIIKGLGAGCDEETLRALGTLPNFKAARHNGKEVRKRMQLPVYFKLR